MGELAMPGKKGARGPLKARTITGTEEDDIMDTKEDLIRWSQITANAVSLLEEIQKLFEKREAGHAEAMQACVFMLAQIIVDAKNPQEVRLEVNRKIKQAVDALLNAQVEPPIAN